MKRPIAGNLLGPLTVVLVGALVRGRPNYLTIGYICPFDFGTRIFFSIYKGRYTCQGIQEHRTFSVNVPSSDMLGRVSIAGSKSGWDYDKSELFRSFYGTLKTAPMIEECPVTIECEVDRLLDSDRNHGVIGSVVSSHIDPALMVDGRPDFRRIDPVVWTNAGAATYYRLGERL